MLKLIVSWSKILSCRVIFEVFIFVEKWSVSRLSTALYLFNNIKINKCEQKSCQKIHFLSTHYKVIKFCLEIFNFDQF